MATQGQRQDFKWRPNDYSSTTLARYDQEADHWYVAFKNAESRHKPVDYGAAFGFIGLLLNLAFTLIWLLFRGLRALFVWAAYGNEKNEVPTYKTDNKVIVDEYNEDDFLSDDELDEIFKSEKRLSVYES